MIRIATLTASDSPLLPAHGDLLGALAIGLAVANDLARENKVDYALIYNIQSTPIPQAAAKAAPGLLVLDANRFLASWRDTPGLRYAAVGTVSGEGAA